MSNLAKFFLHMGKSVFGYDKTITDLTNSLEALGAVITNDDSEAVIPQEYKQKENSLYIYTPAIPKDHPQLQFFQNNNYTLLKRAAVLG